MKYHFLLFIAALYTSFIYSQIEETAPPDYIKTVEFSGNTPQAQLPIIKIGESLKLSFDDLQGDEKDYYYTITHYDYNWNPSDLAKSEYLNGFDDVRIDFYENSFNTLQMYSHYELQIPNRNIKGITKSGNYMIRIFDDRQNFIFSRKFIVYEEVSNVGVAIKRTRNMNFIKTKQVVQFTINTPNMYLTNPLQNVKTLLIQNNNIKTAIKDLKPQFTIGNELIYKYDLEASFWGGNEYFNFDNSDVLGATAMIRRVAIEDLHVNYLYTNAARYNRPYTYNPDINGNFVVRNLRGNKATIDAEYVEIHFALQYLENLKAGQEVHVFGNFNNYTLNETTRMEYDDYGGTFKKMILLKQGFYNYKYVIKNSDGTIDESSIDGSFDQTENDYTVVVYYRDLGGRYDRVIGIGRANSENISSY